MKRIGILTGGGDCPGLNPVIRAVVKTAIEKYGMTVVGFKNGYKGLYNNETVELTLENTSGKLDGKEYYAQEIFDSTELVANLDKNAVRVEHSIYDHIIYDSSTVEKPFAVALDRDPDVKMFFKIPDRFKIDTPIGTYNPDWAVLWERNGEQKLYFILETKGTESLFNLKTPEQLKIHCGKEHFKALGNGLEMHGPIKDWDKFKVNV